MKMRALVVSNKGKLKTIGEMLAKNGTYAADIIPPAYSCENERLVILAVSGKGEPDDVLRRFCFELNKKKAQNVALLVDGDEKMAAKLLEVLRETGTNVIDDIKYVKISGLPFFGGKVTDEEKQDLVAWVKSVIDRLQ